MRGELSKQLEGFISTVNQAIADAKASGLVATPELARAKLEGLSALVNHCPDIAYIENRSIKTDDRNIPVKVYSPTPNKALPVVVYFHGGGHMCGSAELYDPMCRKISLAGHCVVINVDYCLAPEHPFPQGLNEAEYVVKHYKEVLQGVAHNNELMIAGDSAGGAICTSLTMRQVADPELNFTKQILIYPSVDYTMNLPSIVENGQGYFLEKPRIKWYFDNYFLGHEDRKAASPLYGPVNSSSPKTLIFTAGCDPLRDEGNSYAAKLESAGVCVELHHFEQMIHAFMNVEDLVPDQCKKLFQLIGRFIVK
jgi:acetyl esterase/lipase